MIELVAPQQLLLPRPPPKKLKSFQASTRILRITMPFTQRRRPTHGSWAVLARLALCSLVAKGAAGNERCSIDVKIIGADGLRNSDFNAWDKKPDAFVTVDVVGEQLRCPSRVLATMRIVREAIGRGQSVGFSVVMMS